MFGKGKQPPAQPELPPEDAATNGEIGLAEGPEGDMPMSFWDHIGELRGRLIRCALGVIFGFALCFAFASELREFLAVPLHQRGQYRPKHRMLRIVVWFFSNQRYVYGTIKRTVHVGMRIGRLQKYWVIGAQGIQLIEIETYGLIGKLVFVPSPKYQ